MKDKLLVSRGNVYGRLTLLTAGVVLVFCCSVGDVVVQVSPQRAYGAIRGSLLHFGWLPSEGLTLSTLIQSSNFALELLVVPALFAELVQSPVEARLHRQSQLQSCGNTLPTLGFRGSTLLALGTVLHHVSKNVQCDLIALDSLQGAPS